MGLSPRKPGRDSLIRSHLTCPPDGVHSTRSHAIAAIVEDSARQERGIIEAMLGTSLGARSQLALDRLEQFPIDDRLVLAGIVLSLVDDVADIDPVLQKIGQRSLGKRDSTPRRAIASPRHLGN